MTLSRDITLTGRTLTRHITLIGRTLSRDLTLTGRTLTRDLTLTGRTLSRDLAPTTRRLTRDLTLTDRLLSRDVTLTCRTLSRDLVLTSRCENFPWKLFISLLADLLCSEIPAALNVGEICYISRGPLREFRQDSDKSTVKRFLALNEHSTTDGASNRTSRNLICIRSKHLSSTTVNKPKQTKVTLR